MLGEAFFKLGNLAEAESWYQAALRAKPDHVPAHLTYGKLLAKVVSAPSVMDAVPAAAPPRRRAQPGPSPPQYAASVVIGVPVTRLSYGAVAAARKHAYHELPAPGQLHRFRRTLPGFSNTVVRRTELL